MKYVKARLTQFSSIVIMLMILVIIFSVQSFFLYLSMGNDREILLQVNSTANNTNSISKDTNRLAQSNNDIVSSNNEIAESSNQLLESSNRTEFAIAELKELQRSLGEIPLENQETLDNITKSIDSILDRLNNVE